MYHLALRMWADTTTTNLESRLKVVFQDVLTEFKDKRVADVEQRLIAIKQKTIPGIFERRPYGLDKIAAFNEAHKYRNARNQCYDVPSRLVAG